MAIASKLKTIYDSCKDIRDVITEKNSSLGKGNITTLGSDVTKICNPNNYIHKVVREAITETQTDPDTGEETEVVTGYNYKREDEYVGPNYTTIPQSKFNGNTTLSEVIIPDTVTTINGNAFNGCTNLSYINLENVKTLASQSFMHCKSLKTLNMPNLTTIKTQCVFLGSGLVSVIDLGKIVTLTGNSNDSNYSTFSNCKSLETVVLPNTCTTIGKNVFRGCTSLKSINLENIKNIGNYCFSECESLPIDINMPNLTGQLWYNFNKCSSIKNVVNLGSCTGIYGTNAGYNGTFANCSSLETVVLPETCKWLGNNAFYNCTSLRSINLNYITGCNVGYRQFTNCTSLAIDVEMPLLTGNVPTQFFNYSAITGVKNLGSVKSLTGGYGSNDGAFATCKSLIYVILPETITNIGTYTFSNCSALTTVTCNAENPPTLASNAFRSCSALTNIYVPYSEDHSILAAYQAATNWASYSSRIHELNSDGSIPS